MNPGRCAQRVLMALVSLVLSFAGTPALAATWYVTPTGDDASDCQNPSTPCLTINGAIWLAADGDTILVGQGTYAAAYGAEVVYLYKNLTLSGGWDGGFVSQDGTSVIDGGGVRRGLVVSGQAAATGGTRMQARFIVPMRPT